MADDMRQGEELRVLLVEDSIDDALLVLRELQRGGFAPVSRRVQTEPELRDALREDWQIAIVDYRLPGFGGGAALQLIRKLGQDVPAILVSGTVGEEVVAETMKAGAADYLLKDNLRRLVFAVRRELAEAAVRREHRRSQESLRLSEERFRVSLTDSPIVTFANDRELRYTWVYNPGAVFGAAEADIVGKTDAELLSGADLDEFVAFKRRVLASGRPERREFRLQIGATTVWCDVTAEPSRDADGAVVGITCAAVDVSEHRRLEDQLRRSEERYRLLFERTIAGVFQVTRDGRIVAANQALADMLGCASPGEVLSHQFTDFLRQEGRFGELVRETEARGELGLIELPLERLDGATAWVAITATWVLRDGDEPSALGAVLDVSGLRRAREELGDSLQRLNHTFLQVVDSLGSVIELRDPYTAGHQQRVTELATAMAVEMGFSADETEGLRVAAALHDIGKLYVPAEILSKPGRLSSVEMSMVRVHAQAGHDILSPVTFPWPVAEIVLQHHERMDGSGYPGSLSRGEIRREAAVLAVADTVEAMSSHRPYRPALRLVDALDEVRHGRAAVYDADAVDACLHLWADGHFAFSAPARNP
jgi:PAS domain S-box-containing protein/putative nucleotidyltransferase with HDIG domain